MGVYPVEQSARRSKFLTINIEKCNACFVDLEGPRTWKGIPKHRVGFEFELVRVIYTHGHFRMFQLFPNNSVSCLLLRNR